MSYEPVDLDSIKCASCSRPFPIKNCAEIRVKDATPEKALGGGTVTLYLCRACFKKKMGL